jgi:hypothetical protein
VTVQPPDKPRFDQWAIVELMGHVRLAGRLTEESYFGVALGRIDIPNDDLKLGDEPFVPQYFSGWSVYRITPVSEEAARRVAAMAKPAPIYRLELTAAPERPVRTYHDDDEQF